MAEDFDQFAPGEPTNDQTAEGAASLRDTLEKAYAGDQDGTDGAGGAGDGDAADTGEQQRDAAGDDQAAGDTSGADESSTDGTDADGGRKPDALEAPVHWALADREMFAKQTPEAQKFILDRSKAMEAAHTQRSQEIAPIRKVMDEWKPYMESVGARPEVAFAELMKTEHTLRTGTNAQKVEVVRKILHDYGIQRPDGEGQEQQTDPRVAALEARVQEMTASQQQRTTQQEEAAVAQANREIAAFRDATGDDGKPLHPYYGEVEKQMTQLAQADVAAGVQPKIDDLYERAIWMSPVIRPRLIAEEAAKKAAEQAAELERKRNAGSTVSGAGGTAAAQPKSLRETLESLYPG